MRLKRKIKKIKELEAKNEKKNIKIRKLKEKVWEIEDK